MNYKSVCNIKHLIVFMFVITLLQGCGNRYEEEVLQNYQATSERLVVLKRSLDNGSLRNAIMIKTYANNLLNSRSDLKELILVLKKDGTSKGSFFTGLESRLKAVKKEVKNEQERGVSITELNNIWIASDTVIYNDALLDVVNTLADLSNGKLPRININKKAAKNNQLSGSTVPGSYLVGNPSYGGWKKDSSGHSFWEWYGMYSMMSNLTSPGYGYYNRPLYYDSWYGSSRTSYYHDYGRSSYGSRSDRGSWSKGKSSLVSKGISTPARTKSYGSLASKKRVSTYSSNRGASSRPMNLAKSSRRSSNYSSYGSSSRGTSSGSRSSYGGK
ncbi:MAG: hypothetical protein HON94_06175 [Methylococcales bacterium]|nr:hypothetical protein [Methylococcales bacterium]